MTDTEIFTLIAQKEEERSLLRHKYAKEDLIIRDELTKLKNSLLNNESNYWYFDATLFCFVEYEPVEMGHLYSGSPTYRPVDDDEDQKRYSWVAINRSTSSNPCLTNEDYLNELGLFKDKNDAIKNTIKKIKLFKEGFNIECSPVIQEAIRQ